MKILADPGHVLEEGLAALRAEVQLPAAFPPEVLAAAELAAARTPAAHADRTGRPFVTLDPAASTDLDQAFAIEPAGSDLLLHYAIADVGWFVDDGEAIDQEAWRRGTTQYLPDGKVNLYPPVLSEQAASLLPDGPRPAVVFTVRIAPDGAATLDGAERAIIRSRAKLGYETVREADLPDGFAELARRAALAEDRRGASRIDTAEQEVERTADGHFDLRFRPRRIAEDRNAALSLTANLAIAQALLAHRTGLFRTMAGPDDRAVLRLRNTARAYGLVWPHGATLAQFQRMLAPADPPARHSPRRSTAPDRARATSRSSQACCPGTPPSPRLMPTPPRRCAGWPTATWCRRHSPSPTGGRCRRRRAPPSLPCPG